MAHSKQVRVIIAGLGRIGAAHFDNISASQKLKIVGVVDSVEDLRKKYAARASSKDYAELKDALADSGNHFEGVVLCTPTGFHIDHIKLALNAGKAVFCEKPISNDLKAVDEVYHLAKAKNLPLLCGFQRRHDASFDKLKENLLKGTIGNIVKVKTISRDHPFPAYAFLRTSGGIVFDCCSHDVDEQCWLTGEVPDTVYAMGTAIDPEVKAMNDFDTLEVLFRFPSGVMGSIDISRHSTSGYDQRVEVLGTKACIFADNPKESTVVIANSGGFTSEPSVYSFPTRYKQAYSAELEHFADLVSGVATVPKLTHFDVRVNCIILHAIDESTKTGLPVKVKYN